MKVIILAGGRGERLRPLTDTIPKPMIDINGKPALERIIELFKKYAITEFIFTLCYLPKKITSYFGDGSKFGVAIKYMYEETKNPLGTAGSIALARKYINESFIVASGDILRDLNVADMIAFHKNNNAFVTINTYKRYGPNPKSMIMWNKKNRITEFIERPTSLSTDYVWANGSFYILEPEVIDYIPANKSSDFGKDIFPQIIKDGKKIYAFPSSGHFIDIGNLEKLERARALFTS